MHLREVSKVNKKGVVFEAVGFILSLTIGQAIVIAALLFIVYFAGKSGIFG